VSSEGECAHLQKIIYNLAGGAGVCCPRISKEAPFDPRTPLSRQLPSRQGTRVVSRLPPICRTPSLWLLPRATQTSASPVSFLAMLQPPFRLSPDVPTQA
jgi:hypothetical protein